MTATWDFVPKKIRPTPSPEQRAAEVAEHFEQTDGASARCGAYSSTRQAGRGTTGQTPVRFGCAADRFQINCGDTLELCRIEVGGSS
jgi:hypothetical protein